MKLKTLGISNISVQTKRRSNGADVWAWYFRDDANKQRCVTLGRTDRMSLDQAERKAMRLRSEKQLAKETVTVAQMIARYRSEAMPKRISTRVSYESSLKRISAHWGEMEVGAWVGDIWGMETWLKNLETLPTKNLPARPMASKSKFNLKAQVSVLIEYSMRRGILPLGRNPAEAMQLKGAGMVKSVERDRTFTLEQYAQLMQSGLLSRPVHMMCQVAMCLGVRESEFLALRWEDMEMGERIEDGGTVYIRRSFVGKNQDATKTDESQAVLPLHPALLRELLLWRKSTPPINGWVFGSSRTGRPFHGDSVRADHLKPAGAKLGILHLGWHSFRHTHREMLHELDVPLDVQKWAMRHTDLKTTLKYGGKAGARRTEKIRPANALLVEQVVGAVAGDDRRVSPAVPLGTRNVGADDFPAFMEALLCSSGTTKCTSDELSGCYRAVTG